MILQRFLAMLFVVFIAATGAEEVRTPKVPTLPGVLLTFDDAHVDEWVKVIPLCKKYDAHVTFFVTNFDRLSPAQVEGLRTLQEAGHSIGCHGLRHIKATVRTAEKGVDDYMAVEITPALKHMAEAGFTPTSFAYPMSDNNATTDAALLTPFRHLRTGTGVKEGQRLAQMDILFTPLAELSNRGVLTGKGIDRIGYPGNEDQLAQLLEALDRAADKKEVLTLYAHGIAESGKHHHIRPATLEKVLAHAQKHGLHFYTFDELP